MRHRILTIAARHRLTPHMIRLTLKGVELHGFVSLEADDHLKLHLPGPEGEAVARDITPRRHDADALVIDIVDHGGGGAAGWARNARPGDPARISGPRGSAVIGGRIDHWLLIGDESALPAIGRRVETLPKGIRATSLIAVPGTADEQRFETAGRHRGVWLHRPLAQASDPAPFLDALGELELPPRCFVWIAAEADVARAIRGHFLAAGHLDTWMKTSGYWTAAQGASQGPVDDT